MPLFGINPEKEAALRSRMEALGIRETDLEEKFLRQGGPGGQKINKTSSAVRLLYRPAGLEVRVGRERSQALNRYLARRELCDRLEAARRGEADTRKQEREKIRRQKRTRTRRQKARMLAGKRKQSDKKRTRARPGSNED
jgi:protein subunit release factor B